MADDKQFYVGLKAFIKKVDEVLVLFDGKDLDFPGGKIQEGETDLLQAMKREVKEETNLEITNAEPFTTWMYRFRYGRNKGEEVFLVGFRCTYVGGKILLSNEHSSYQWVNKNNYRKVNDGSVYFTVLEKYFKKTH